MVAVIIRSPVLKKAKSVLMAENPTREPIRSNERRFDVTKASGDVDDEFEVDI